MNQNELIEKIASEVMKKMHESGSSVEGAKVQPASGDVSGSSKTDDTGRIVVLSQEEMAAYIDHTLLKPDSVKDQFDQLCDEAKQYQFKSVCVNSSWTGYVSNKLQGTGIEICTVVGFPLGAATSRSKAFETREAISHGATEIDMVINVGALKSKHFKEVEEDIRAVRRATRANTVLKVILETCMLTDEEKIVACELSKKAGADFVKTSTGFGGGGATVEDVTLMRKIVGPDLGVKASGGIKNWDQAVAMIKAGASRLGMGASVAVMTGAPVTGDY